MSVSVLLLSPSVPSASSHCHRPSRVHPLAVPVRPLGPSRCSYRHILDTGGHGRGTGGAREGTGGEGRGSVPFFAIGFALDGPGSPDFQRSWPTIWVPLARTGHLGPRNVIYTIESVGGGAGQQRKSAYHRQVVDDPYCPELSIYVSDFQLTN